ncbi:MAG: hypothetical protein HN712_12900 [Gemmatimonadetes bacterium]|jgi:hypothetical protein|nr:hypothetical protein [Gemmatimonadota bacterium]
MSFLFDEREARTWLRRIPILWVVCLIVPGNPLEAQRHPESEGANVYYTDEPGVPRDPDWQKRPPFLRAPWDRYERGRTRLFLNAEDPDDYTNYAQEDYIPYFRAASIWELRGGRPFRFRQMRFDRAGEYMGDSYWRAFSFEEARSSSDHSGFSTIDHKDRDPTGDVPLALLPTRLRASYSAYHDLRWMVTAGTAVRTRFSPLTLVQSHLPAVRLDMNYKNRDMATLLYNRGRGGQGLFSTWAYQEGDDLRDGGFSEEPPILTYGMHLHRMQGKYISVGATYVNQLMQFPSSPRSDGLRGDLPYDMGGPTRIKVFVADDLPDSPTTTARAYGVHLEVDGLRAGERVRLSTDPNDANFDAALSRGLSVSGGVQTGDGGREAAGTDAVVYEFTMPEDVTVTGARFEAEVEGDYRLGVRQTHMVPLVDQVSGDIKLAETVWPALPLGTEARRAFKWYVGPDEEPYYTVARSTGQGIGGQNRRRVGIDYGMPTGQSLASIDWNANLVGLKFSGEIAHNLQNFMFPIENGLGDRSSQTAWAWWTQVSKRLLEGRVDIGGEIYRLEPDYSGGYDSLRGGLPFHLDQQRGTRALSTTQEFPMVEDNDDNDQWPDDFDGERPAIGDEYPGSSSSQVYPGLDENSDSISDIDRNENFILDWQEPFLTYDSDPREFVYGIDFNNNDIPDFRENDDLPDYPYRRDHKGNHVFLRLNQLGRFARHITIGGYKAEEIAGGREAHGLYVRYANVINSRRVGRVQINGDIKRVEDEIPDHSFIFFVPPDDNDIIPWLNWPDHFPDVAGRFRPATPDPMLMRDSWVSTVFIDHRYQGIDHLSLSNSVVWVRNSQAEVESEDGSLLQPDDVRTRFGMVNKVDYSWRRGALRIHPKLKIRFLTEGADSDQDPHRSFVDLIPIIEAYYSLTANTHLMAGAQGLPLGPYKHWDRSDNTGTFDQTDYLGMVRMDSEYFGRQLSYFLGYQLTSREYERLKDRNTDQGTLFVELMVPF